MPNKTGIGVSTDAVLGGGIKGSLEAWKQDRSRVLSAEIVELRSTAEDIQIQANTSPVLPAGTAEAVGADINGIAQSASAELAAISDEKHAAKRFQIVFQIKHNLDRQPVVPEPYDSLPALATMAMVEGVATSAFFYGSGLTSGMGGAAALGLTISSVNVVLSAGLGGFVCGRYWNYGAKCRDPDTIITIKKWAGRTGAVLTAGAIGTLLVASGVVRATGDTEQLSYSFESLSTAASDFNSLMLWGIGASFSVLSWRKGLSAFSDSYPGFAEAAMAVVKASAKAERVRDDALDHIDDLHEDALADIDDIRADIDDQRQDLTDVLRDFQHDRERVISAITQANTDFEAYRAEQINLHHMITGSKPDGHDTPGIQTDELLDQVPNISIDTAAFSSGFPDANKRARTVLAEARKSAVEAIHSAFKTSLS